jgi:NAD(P)-dependent dehydrogenase (short-subunit alcohol dehydrogenase family)
MLSGAISRSAKSPEEVKQIKNQFRRGHMGLSTPEEIASTYLFLASEHLSSKVTGHILLADNGFSMLRL